MWNPRVRASGACSPAPSDPLKRAPLAKRAVKTDHHRDEFLPFLDVAVYQVRMFVAVDNPDVETSSVVAETGKNGK